MDDLTRLQRLVLADPALRARLLATPEPGAFARAVTDIARQHHLDVTADDVDAALRAARRRWRARWV